MHKGALGGPLTARVTTLEGVEVGAYYVEALPSYYLDAGEPEGRWLGAGSECLGLNGEVGDAAFLAVMAGVDPFSGEVLGRAYGERSVRGFDVTASAPKSVSVLWAVGDENIRAEVLGAHDRAVAVMAEWIESHAHTRYRVDGEVIIVDAQGIVAAGFRQHTSRALDPQLHTHVVVANKVRSPDGRWLALDARSLKLDQRTLSAIYHATLRSELTGRLGVAWQPVVNGIAELDHMDDMVLAEFSSRTADVRRRLDVKLDRFAAAFDREPTARERWRLEREAAVDSRPAKPVAVNAAALHARWVEQVGALGHEPANLVNGAVGWITPRRLDARSGLEVALAGLDAIVEKQSSWRPAELTREIAAAFPTDTALDPSTLVEQLEELTALAIERCVDISRPIPAGVGLRRDGRPVTESVADRALTTPAILAQEERLLSWAERRTARQPLPAAGVTAQARVELTGPQEDLAGAVAGDGDLVLAVGPAGTGKTTALAPAVELLREQGRVVFGVAPSAAAAEVLAVETGVEADTIDKLLVEHGLDRPPDHRYTLPVGATVIVDEAAMTSTDNLDRLARLADRRGWRVVLVGDPLQFSAVGRGGMFELLVDSVGEIELDRVHRFTHGWERDASLRLRRGDSSVARLYDVHGRLHGGTPSAMHAAAVDSWWAALAAGETALLTAPTNDATRQLNHLAQRRRIDEGELDPTGRHVDADGARLYVGDEIVTRQNQRRLKTDRGLMVRNRDHWAITAIGTDGSLQGVGESGTVRLPARYVADHVELGYAQTSHASQGRTVDRSIFVLDGPTDCRGVYVPMTRGRHTNTAYIAIKDEQAAVDVLEEAIGRNWIDRPALTRMIELGGPDFRWPGTLPADQLRQLLERSHELAETLAELGRDLHDLPRKEAQLQAERTTLHQRASDTRSRYERAIATLDRHDRPFRRRGHEADIRTAHAIVASAPTQIVELNTRIRAVDETMRSVRSRRAETERLDRQCPDLTNEVSDIARRLNKDLRLRARAARHTQPDHLTHVLGHRPNGHNRCQAWDEAAGALDQHRTAYGDNRPVGHTIAGLTGYSRSQETVDRAITSLTCRPQTHHRTERMRQEPQPDTGIEL